LRIRGEKGRDRERKREKGRGGRERKRRERRNDDDGGHEDSSETSPSSIILISSRTVSEKNAEHTDSFQTPTSILEIAALSLRRALKLKAPPLLEHPRFCEANLEVFR